MSVQAQRSRRVASNHTSMIATFRRAVDAIERDDPRAAIPLLNQILRNVPTNADAQCLRGIAALRVDDIPTALKHLRNGTRGLGAIDLNNCDAFNEYALALRFDQQYDEAERVLRSIVAAEPRFGPAWHNLALVLQANEAIDEAVAAARHGVAARPDEAGAHLLLGKLLRTHGRLLSARSVLRRAESLAPDDVSVLTTLGNTYFYLGEIDASLECFRKASELRSDEPVFHSNYATMLTHCRRYDEARVEHERAFALAPQNPDVIVRRAAFLLNTSDLATGWAAYDSRLVVQPKSLQWTGTPTWTGELIANSTLCVYREQGIGDEIMFASVYGELIEAARTLIIECDPRLENLYRESFRAAVVRSQTHAGNSHSEHETKLDEPRRLVHPDADFVVPAGSTLQFLRPRQDSFPHHNGYLTANAALQATWRDRLEQLPGNGPCVGISWRSMVRTAERRLEYTRLDEWGEILSQGQDGAVRFVLLQYDKCEREVTDAERRFDVRIHRWHDLDLMNDFDNVAALTTSLTAVIAPRNAVAMLSGALGTPTLALGNVGDWAECGTSQLPWFTQLECINRAVDGNWSPVIEETATRLRRHINGGNLLNDISQRKATV